MAKFDRLKKAWAENVHGGASGALEASVGFVAELGRMARIIDVRERDEVSGLLGHVPGCAWVPLNEVATLPEKLGRDSFVILVSNRGDRAARAAVYLQGLGMEHAAAMKGGMIAWKQAGFSASRTDRPLTRELGKAPSTVDANAPISRERVERHVGHPSNVRWVKLAALLVYGKRSCVDGRDEQGVIGTPGGDAGEFILALGALEQVTGHVLSDNAVEGLLRAELDTFGRFYLHTDANAFHRLEESLKKRPELKDAVAELEGDVAWHRFVDRPRKEHQSVLLEELLKPEHIGCGHIKLMLLNPNDYGVRPALVKAVLSAFHRLRWSGSPDTELVTLGGEHNEVAVLNVVVDSELWDFAAIPLVSPAVGASQLFINHPQVAAQHRDHYVEFFKRLEPLKSAGADKVAAFGKAMNDLANRQLGHTLHHLAKGLPIYEAHYLSEDKVRVEESGRVG